MATRPHWTGLVWPAPGEAVDWIQNQFGAFLTTAETAYDQSVSKAVNQSAAAVAADTTIARLAAGVGDDAIGGIADSTNQRTWLEFNAAGEPSTLAANLIGKALGFGGGTSDGTVTLTVKPDGTGDYTHPKTALAAIPTTGNRPPYVVLVYPGTYETIDLVAHPAGDTLTVPDRVTVRGTNRDAVILHGECPAGTATNVVQASPAVDLSKNGGLENLTVIGTNTRYPVHSESSGNFPNATQATRNVRVISTSAGTAWGCGVSSGNVQTHTGSVFDVRGGNSAVTVHNNLAFAKPISFAFDKCSFVAPIGYVKLQSLGAGQQGMVTMTGCDLSVSAVQYDDTPWMPTTAAGQCADHVEIELWASGRQKVPWSCINRGRALRIDSVTTTGETVAVSGTAASLLMGPAPLQTLGGGGLTTYLTGYWDMSGITVGSAGTTAVANTLGKRLGDCSAASKSLTVKVGAASKTVTFSTNLTAVDNATILAQINTALSGTATAALFDVSGNHRYPQFTDRQTSGMNVSGAGIGRWSPVGYAADGTLTAMTGSTPFAGIALDQIPSGTSGRVLTCGAMFTATQMAGLAAATVNAGTAIYLGTGGTFSLAGTVQLATGVRAGVATFQGVGA